MAAACVMACAAGLTRAQDAGGPDEVVVELVDGRRVTGLLVGETPEGLVLRVEGIDTPVERGLVASVDLLPSVLERYGQMRAAIRDDDTARRLDLAEWLRAREQYGLALVEVQGVLGREPDNARARRMAVMLEQLILLRSKRGAETPGQEHAPPEPPRREDAAAFPRLSDEQVNLIKVYELNLSDPPRLMVPRDVIDEVLERYKGHDLVPLSREGRAALYRAPAAEIVDLLFKLRARELYPRVQVLGQPDAMALFRDDVHRTWLMNACATSQCHGGAEAGRLQLATERINSDRTVYTNFLILDRFRLADPTGERPDGIPLIDWERPERSPLLQMGLPADVSLHPHPTLVGRQAARFRPVFRSMDDGPYRAAVAWLEGMYRPRPEYPVAYEPPKPLTPGVVEPLPR